MKPPHYKAQKEKEFRKISKREEVLYQRRSELGFIKLEKPIRHGWCKVIELTPAVEKYKNSDAIKEVFKKIRTSYWGTTKEKAQQHWDQERSRYLLSKDKPTITRKSYNKLSEKGKGLCVQFWYRDVYQGRYKKRYYVNLPVGCFEIRYRRSYITHRKRIDPLIEEELSELGSQCMSPRLFELTRSGRWFRWSRMIRSFENKVEAHRVKEKLGGMRGVIDCLSDYDVS